MTQKKDPYKPRRSPVRRFWKPLAVFPVLAIIAILGVVSFYTLHHKPKQAFSNTDAAQGSGGLSVSTQSTGSISLGDELPEAPELLTLINEARTTNGVPPVTEDSLLDQSASLKLNDMITRNYWSHNTPDGTEPWVFFKQVGYVYKEAGENLAYGQYKYQPEQEIVRQWLNSPEHRENMLASKYANIGIAIRKADNFNGENNVYVIVTHYGTRISQTSYSSQGTTQTSTSNSIYVPPTYTSTPMPTFDRPATVYQQPTSTPACANPSLADSSYYCGQ